MSFCRFENLEEKATVLDLSSCKDKRKGAPNSRRKTHETRNKIIPGVRKKIDDTNFVYDYCDSKSLSRSEININRFKFQSRQNGSKHADEKILKCTRCKYQGKSVQDIKQHMDYHCRDKTLICAACNYECFTSNELKINKNNSIACFRYLYKCKTPEEMRIHLKCHTNQVILKCKHCCYTCFAKSALNHHQNEHKNEYFVLQRKSQEESSVFMKSHLMEALKCDYCDNTFFKFASTKMHAYKRPSNLINSTKFKDLDGSGIQVLRCRNCNFKTPVKSCFKRHLNITHKNNHYDSYSYVMTDTLYDDDRDATSERIFQCGFCNFKASNLRGVKYHTERKHALTHIESKAFDKNDRSKQSLPAQFKKRETSKQGSPVHIKKNVEKNMKYSLGNYKRYSATPLNVFQCCRRRYHTKSEICKCKCFCYQGKIEENILKHKEYRESKEFRRLRGSSIKINKCTLCAITFELRSSLRIHLMMHFDEEHVEEKMKYSVCDYTCFCNTPLNVFKEKAKRCKKILKHKEYRESKEFRRLRESSVKRINKCTLCDIDFEFRSTLRIHLMKHFDEKFPQLSGTVKTQIIH